MAPVRYRTTDVDGFKIFYREAGRLSAEAGWFKYDRTGRTELSFDAWKVNPSRSF
jgi:hypothetical protein